MVVEQSGAMSAVKSVIITLPAKSLSAAKTGRLTPILVDKIKMESGGVGKLQAGKNSPATAVVPKKAVIFKQDNLQELQVVPAMLNRGKKRKLDHLTWEEKLQRKKLKNRVAAQTSRDRKKAKLDELEESVMALHERNNQLEDECSKLRLQNELLVTEIQQLKKNQNYNSKATKEDVCSMCQARVDCAAPTLGSAVSPIIDPLQQGGVAQKARAVTTLSKSASVVLKILTLYLLSKTYLANQGENGNEYIERLEELAESLMREVAAQVETNSPHTDEQDAVEKESACELDITEEMVGQASSYVEADATDGNIAMVMDVEQSQAQVIPQVNLLPTDLIPTITLNASDPITIADNIVQIKEEPMQDTTTELVYGTYDEATNCITIIYPEEEVAHLTISEQPQSPQYLLSPSYSYDSMSPQSVHSEDTDLVTPVATMVSCKSDYVHSDAGYESPGSPESVGNDALTDLWQEDFRELFPTLA
ncbi:LOW QUALITY PROTEIN: uncharacterized protein LOC106637139 [Copidosoma floridanum]|uniref:LOW QUALITY PROTEIN: uncharacterized protein LOC106637139 n=1 Tax=Copidosoma floridanum TaxID=29053 RepID=UPI000C6FC23F|nr:LOW QUALITY PROTEIN: uncharacterized protein LOC106637139 [Copidosoma floridanum]